jgi:hypothetical protein
MATFIRQYARKRQKGMEPNDRSYSRDLEKKIKRMKPAALDDLLKDRISSESLVVVFLHRIE